MGTGSPSRTHSALLLLRCLCLDRQEELELRGQLLLAVQPVREVYPADSAICMQLHTQRLDVVCAISPTCEVGEVELDLIPTLVKSHGHRADEGLDPGRALVIGRSKPSSH